MTRIPASVERRLESLFPRIRDREQFVKDALESAITDFSEPAMEPTESPVSHIGGTLHLFSDGGSRGNPGQAAIAYILEDPTAGKVLKEYKERIGVETNNVAEYRALIEGLKAARHFQPNRLVCHLDSELIVKQLNGEYQVKMPTLKEFVETIREVENELADVLYVHIPRADNYRADALVNRALDEDPTPPPKKQFAPTEQQNLFSQRSIPSGQSTSTNQGRPGDAYRQSQSRSF